LLALSGDSFIAPSGVFSLGVGVVMREWTSEDGRVRLINGDCVEYMKGLPDKCYELAVVDPPYGVDMSQELFKRGQSCAANGYKQHADKDWGKTQTGG
jgi:site-specific DNA-methyltransferase (adenine-specific)